MKRNRVLKSILCILIGGIMMFSMFGCGGVKYHVDYNGEKEFFNGAKDAYRPGAGVTLYYNMIATDTDYAFYLDGERLNPDYSEEKGYIIRFTMPEHNVKLSVESHNSMVYVPDDEPEKEITLSFDSFDGGGPDYSAVIEDPGILDYSYSREYSSPYHDQMDGAGFTVYLTFWGLQPGSTTVTVRVFSPIEGDSEILYRAEVDEELNVTLTELEVLSQDEIAEEPYSD